MFFRYIQRTLLLTMLLVLSADVFGNIVDNGIAIDVKAPSELIEGEQFRVKYIVISTNSERFADVELDKSSNFSLVAGPRRELSYSRAIENGQRVIKYYLTYTYIFQADKAGSFQLPQARMTLDGKTYKSEKVKIQVVANKTDKKAIKEIKDDGAFVVVTASRQRVGVSDTLTVRYKLYSEIPVLGVEGYYNFPLPRQYFYIEDMTNTRQSQEKEVYEGKEYYVKDIRVLLLQPRGGEGRKIIKGGTVEMIYEQRTGGKVRNRYGEIIDEAVYLKKKLEIEDIAISVMNLIGV